MNTDKITKKLKNQSITDDKWLSEAKERQENEGWLDLSAAIAVRILTYLRVHKITQKELSERLGYSPQYMNKIVKGSENLTLESIVKIENAIDIKLISIVTTEDTLRYNPSIHDLAELDLAL